MNTITSFTNHLLIAMPNMADSRFTRSVIYLCEHNENGAIGIVINHPLEISLSEVFQQMDIEATDPNINALPVLAGGPIHQERGFVLHTPGGNWRSSLEMSSEIAVTTSRDILQAIAQNKGPEKVVISLGYASWTAGQLEREIMNNFWLVSPSSADILFTVPFPDRWTAAARLLGIDITKLSSDVGHG
jgi:putative transcriptional regulator